MLTVKRYPDSHIVLSDDLEKQLEEIKNFQVTENVTLHIADKVFLSLDSGRFSMQGHARVLHFQAKEYS